MMIGNIGSGKSEFSEHLLKKLNKAIIVNMDSITEMFHGRYGAYDVDMKPLYQKTEEAAIETALSSGVDVIIDRTNLDKRRRARFIEICNKYGAEVQAYQFPVDPFSCGMFDRRMKNPRGVSGATWHSVLQKMYESYEPPTKGEGFSELHDFYTVQPRHEFLAVDFDGTIAENKFPNIGDPVPEVIAWMEKFWWQSMFCRIIIWSCRTGEHELLMREWLIKNKVPFDFINDNPIVNFGRKVFAHNYLDDRNMSLMSVM